MVPLAIGVHVIYANVCPVPALPFNAFPYVVAAWLIPGLGTVLFVPGLARRIDANLAEREGLSVEESPGSQPHDGREVPRNSIEGQRQG